MTDRVGAPYSLTGAQAPSVARRALRLCLPVLVWAALLYLTLPAKAAYMPGNVPELFAGDPIGLASQGFSVAVSADGATALVGGPFDSSGAGAAWIFTRSGGTWFQLQKLTADDATGCAPSDLSACPQFGWSVSMSADGNTAIVGGPGDKGSAGAAWVFVRDGSSGWIQQMKLVGSGAAGKAEQGYAVALAADGNTAIVGGWADNSALGAAWVFRRSGTTWNQQGEKLFGTDYVGSGDSGATNVMQGFSVALSGDGNLAIIGGPNDNTAVGAAWLFRRSGGRWNQEGAKLVGMNGGQSGVESEQGFSVALSRDGNTAIVGGPGEETYAPGTSGATSQTCSTGQLKPPCKGTLSPPVIVTPVAMSNGAAWVFTRSNGTWDRSAGGTMRVGTSAPRSNPGQGFSVALSDTGDTLLVGGPTDNANTGAAWAFNLSGGTWTAEAKKLVGTGAVGAAGQASSVALSRDGTVAIIGGPLDQDQAGAVWVFVTRPALAVIVSGSGSVTSSPPGIDCGSTCNANFGYEANVGLTATPPGGWAFSGWSGACRGSGSCTVTMDSGKSVTATFVQLFTLTVTDNGAGTITSSLSNIDCQTTCGASYRSGTQVTLVATPQSGYIFAGWSGACSGTGSCVVTMSMAENVTAMFYLAPTRTYVSGTGDDANQCSRTAPCKTFAGAISKTATGGEIDVLDPGGFGAVTITKAITIDGGSTMASILAPATNGIVVNAGATDTVVLRNLSIDGSGPTLGLNGISFLAGLNLVVENCAIFNFSQHGIIDFSTTTNGSVYVGNVVTGNANVGMGIGAAATHKAVVDNFRSFGNLIGLATGIGNSVTVRNSNLSSNTATGLENDGATISVDNSVIANNGIGVLNQSSGTMRLSDNDLAFNTTGIKNASGSVFTYGTNRNSSTTTATIGTVTAAGSASSVRGQQ